MDFLVNEMTGESLEHIGQLVVAKLKEKQPDERRMAVNQIFDAIYAPVAPVDNRLEHLVTYIREAYSDLGDSDEAKKTFTAQMRTVCMQMGSTAHHNNPNVENIANEANQNIANQAAPATWYGRGQKLGKKVRILVGSHAGTIARVDSISNDTLSIQLADGKIVKYKYKHIEFVD